jgi:hypothetical protein
MPEVYAITDLDGYATQMRDAAAKSLVDNSCEDNLDDFMSITQLVNLVKSECLGFDDENRPLLDEDTNEKIFETTAIWIHNVGLAKLAAKDLVECAWDDECNDMVFWIKQKETNDKPKSRRKNPKTKGQDC